MFSTGEVQAALVVAEGFKGFKGAEGEAWAPQEPSTMNGGLGLSKDGHSDQ